MMFVKGSDARAKSAANLEANLPMPMILYGVERDLSFSVPKKELSQHDCYELSYLRSGSMEFYFEGEAKPLRIQAGNTVIIRPEVPHRIRVLDRHCETITIYFDFLDQETLDEEIRESRSKECFNRFLAFALEKDESELVHGQHPYLWIRGREREQISAMGDSIVREIKEDQFGSKMMCRALATQLLVVAARAIHQEWEESLRVLQGRGGELIQLALRFIREHYHENITTSDIAQYVFLSPGYFSRSFREHMKESPNQYLNGVRAEAAKRLLEESDLRISSVAHAVGYPNPQRLNVVFKKYTGMTPKEYRRSHPSHPQRRPQRPPLSEERQENRKTVAAGDGAGLPQLDSVREDRAGRRAL